jgi:hypothetical protein
MMGCLRRLRRSRCLCFLPTRAQFLRHTSQCLQPSPRSSGTPCWIATALMATAASFKNSKEFAFCLQK